MNQKLQALADRRPAVATALATQQRFSEVNGGFVASAITISIFLSVFPLLLVAISVVGFLASGDQGFADRFVDSLGLTGNSRSLVTNAVANASNSRRTASLVGLVGLAWSGTGVGLALQRGVRAPWQEPSRGLKDRLQAMLWLIAAALVFVLAIAISSLLNWLPEEIPAPAAWLLAVAAGLAIEFGLFVWMFWGLSTRQVSPRQLFPGAVMAAVGFEMLKLVGTVAVPRMVASSSSLYGPLGVVFAILAWLAIFARLLVYASALNAVTFEREAGTRTVSIYVPALPQTEILAANRGGTLVSQADLKPRLAIPVTPVDTDRQEDPAGTTESPD